MYLIIARNTVTLAGKKNYWEIDIWIPELNIGFEYQVYIFVELNWFLVLVFGVVGVCRVFLCFCVHLVVAVNSEFLVRLCYRMDITTLPITFPILLLLSIFLWKWAKKSVSF